jgi:CBS domain
MNQLLSGILDEKGHDVLRIDADASVFEAVKRMVEANVGSLLVTESGEITGIVTERDYLRRAALEGRADRETAVREIMSSPLLVAHAGDDSRRVHGADDREADSPRSCRRRRRGGRDRLDRGRRQVQVEAAELRDPIPTRLHHCKLTRCEGHWDRR